MPLPTRKIIGQAVYGDNTGASGTLLFSPEMLVAYEGVVLLPGPVTVIAGNGGNFEVELATTDAEGYSPDGWVWSVEERWPGGRKFFFELPSGTPILYTSLIPAESIADPYAAHTHTEFGIGTEGPQGPQGPQGADGADGDGVAYYGQLSRQTSGVVPIATQGVYVPIELQGDFDSNDAFGLEQEGPFTLKNVTEEAIFVTAIGSFDASSGNQQVLGGRLAVNGVTIPESECRAATGTVNLGKLMSQWMITLEPGDELGLAAANFSAAANVTVQRAKLVTFTPGRQGDTGETGPQGEQGPVGTVRFDGGTPDTDFSAGVNIDCGGVE